MKNFILKKLLPESTKKIIKEKLGVPSQENSLKHIKHLGFNPRYCLDIGAYEGNWATDFKGIFPESRILMIEGQIEKENSLIKIKDSYKDIDYIIALLGASDKVVTFNKYDTASSVLIEHHETRAETEKRNLITLNSILKNSLFDKPFYKSRHPGI